MSVPQIDSALSLRDSARMLSAQLDELLRPADEVEALAELRAAGVSENRIRTLYPLRHDAYAGEIETMLERPTSWFNLVLAELRVAMRLPVLPDVIQQDLDRRTSTTGWGFSSSSIFADSARDNLAYIVATVHVLAQADLASLTGAEELLPAPHRAIRPWWEQAGEDLAHISQLLTLTRFMLVDFEQAKSNGQFYTLHDPMRLLGHESN